ncbi:MAG: LysR family transcriptional regulator [Gammaproteobacteria bacterium]|jgi:DNA-binding transcriptional LysR family regulator|nr:LysR family transcriptional regulator [Gammaproteobacteria bacterium]MBU1506101.1 LysR family transcriptional regulator [Gammaproteobacteria bacterium]MBU2119730.1 LysR family transcriptional regulator [Gammaproteobacteria bacterium]MBU2170302.1 LysR family transcriptional regulator [Gammaproteobacteria bacterium]MBU2202917.1 LysR family transcriptional regulator [Gammaproteobacteria bacterium]
MAINELRAISTFVKAAELGSLRQAAAAQGITPQAASQALVQLESHLGVRLFHRTTRSLGLTEEGRQFLASAQPGLATLQQAVEEARRGREEMAGPLRIVAPRSILLDVIWPVLTEFCRRHPDVEPDVQLDDRIGNWVEDRVDVGFRSGNPPEGSVVARRLLTLQLIVCAAPSYIAQHGEPTTIEELAQHRCTGFRHPATGKPMPWEFQVGDDIVSRNITAAFCTNDIEVEARAVLGGHAIGQLVGVTAAPLVRSGQLVPLLTAHVAEHLGLFVYYGSRTALPARVRAFIDLAVEMVAGNPAFGLTAQELTAPAAKPRRRKQAAA